MKTETTAMAIVFLNLNHDLRNKLISFSPIIVTMVCKTNFVMISTFENTPTGN